MQVGIQSLNDETLAANGRAITSARIADAMALLRQFGFKSHVHFMVNLLGADPVSDIADYRRLVTDPAFLPDEVKLYPCCLVESAQLTDCYEAGCWRPYTEEELVEVLGPGRAGHPALDTHLPHDPRHLRHRHPRRQQEDQPAPSGRSRR